MARVIHFVSSMDPANGGVSQAVETLVRELSRYNLPHEIVTCDSANEEYLKNCTSQIIPLGPPITSWRYTRYLTNWLSQHLSDNDILVVHGLWQFQTYAISKAIRKKKRRNTKLFIMPHGMLDPWFQNDPTRRLKAIRNWFIWHLVEHRLIKIANSILFTCETEMLLARETFSDYKPKSEEIVGLGIDPPPVFDLTTKTLFLNKFPFCANPFILFLGRLHPKKGVDSLVKVYLKLKSNNIALPSLVIAGPGLETDFGKEIFKTAGDNGNIYFTGMIYGAIKWGAINCCEAVILPSHQENFGIAIVEAMACEKPVLISNQVNIWREVSDGNGGIIGEDNEQGIEDMLMKWSSMSAKQKKTMASNARIVYETHFEVNKTSKKLNDILLNG